MRRTGVIALILIAVVGKLRLRARNVVEPAMAVLILRSSLGSPGLGISPSSLEGLLPLPEVGSTAFEAVLWLLAPLASLLPSAGLEGSVLTLLR